MAPSGRSFKFDSQHVFLTYAQCSLSWTHIVDHLRTIKDIAWARVCTERHADGNLHLHAVAKFVSRVQLRDERAFDIQGFHPNIQRVRSVKHAVAYVSKDGEFNDVGPVPAGRESAPDWMELASSSSEVEFFKAALEHRLPYQYASKFWQLGCKQSCEVPEDYVAVLERECAQLQEMACPEGTVIVVGPSGVGKTSWAKRVSAKPALWVRHIDVLRSFRPRYHKSIIFDDMSFQHLPRESQIHIVDQTDEAHVHCRYGHAVIPAGTQKIFTANNYPFISDPAIDRRVNHINLF